MVEASGATRKVLQCRHPINWAGSVPAAARSHAARVLRQGALLRPLRLLSAGSSHQCLADLDDEAVAHVVARQALLQGAGGRGAALVRGTHAPALGCCVHLAAAARRHPLNARQPSTAARTMASLTWSMPMSSMSQVTLCSAQKSSISCGGAEQRVGSSALNANKAPFFGSESGWPPRRRRRRRHQRPAGRQQARRPSALQRCCCAS